MTVIIDSLFLMEQNLTCSRTRIILTIFVEDDVYILMHNKTFK